MIRITDARHGLRLAAVVAALTTAALTSAAAQSATGTIEGVVVDPSGAVLPAATVTLHQPATGHTRTTVSDSMGAFRAPLLPVGRYEVAVALREFEPLRRADLVLTVGQTVTLRIEMRVAGVAETVSVSGVPPEFERSRTGATATIDEVAIRNLPVNGRNFLEFVLLTPGVTRDVRPGDLSFAGQRGTLNSLLVDGADNNNTFFGQALGRTGSGRAPYQFSLDAVQEFQVNANAYSAEYGRAAGAVVNAVTRSGTNDLRGSLFEYYRLICAPAGGCGSSGAAAKVRRNSELQDPVVLHALEERGHDTGLDVLFRRDQRHHVGAA